MLGVLVGSYEKEVVALLSIVHGPRSALDVCLLTARSSRFDTFPPDRTSRNHEVGHSMAAFSYNVLPNKHDIRLLQLRPGTSTEDLNSDIITVPLTDKIEYVALSYVWGSDEKPHAVTTSSGFIQITTSLKAALISLRSSEHDVFVWAEAICINQSDDKEKNHQVRLMRSIYEKATMVHIHLGDEADNRHLAYDILRKLATVNISEAYEVGPEDPISNDVLRKEKPGILPSGEHESWEAVRAILKRPWFRRVWVVQEVAVGKDVGMSCGGWRLNWLEFAEAFLQCHNHLLPTLWEHKYDKEMNTALEHGERNAWFLIRIRSIIQDQKYWPLLDLLDQFRNTSSTRARDHLFALLGLASDGEDTSFDPDYAEPFESIVRRFGAALVHRGRSEQLIMHAGLASQPSRFPSWIPDWTRPDGRLILKPPDGAHHYDAAKGTTAHMSVTDNNTTLVLRGGMFDVITKVGQCHMDHPDYASTSKPLQPVVDRLAEADSMIADLDPYPTGESVADAFWRTLIANRENYAALDEAPKELGDLLPLSRGVLRGRLAKDRHADPDGRKMTAAWPYLAPMLKTFEWMQFCVTRKGYMGLCANGTKPGDLLYVVLGLPLPFAFRRCEDRSGFLRLAGQGYIHGIMKGEAMNADEFVLEDLHVW